MYIELKTERLLLRPLTTADLDAVHAYAGDPENARELRYALHQTTSCTDAIR